MSVTAEDLLAEIERRTKDLEPKAKRIADATAVLDELANSYDAERKAIDDLRQRFGEASWAMLPDHPPPNAYRRWPR